MEEITVCYEALVEYGGEKIVDCKVANLLRALNENRSLISASKALGIPYSRLWNTISKIERLSGRKIVEAKKGGKEGGKAELTEFGKRLLEAYEKAIERLEELGLIGKQRIVEKPEIVIAHSHDPIFSIVIERLGEDFSVRSLCVGSGMALAMLTLGEADIACLHLYDPETGTYNTSFIEKFWLRDKVEKIGALKRELVIAYRRDLKFRSIDELIVEVLSGNLRVANRNRGSGTRQIFDQVLGEYSEKLKLDKENICGYETEFYTHEEIAKQISESNFDVGVLVRYFAEKYSLRFLHLAWESYECFALKKRKSMAIERLREIMSSDWFQSLIKITPGYKA
ncbi:MAG: LysR family transcriptional regulator [Archaeoglobaceae archaeon]|nr:LysR family transcriptional regulator [Archaeoglobaceae archaeon]MDW8117397.1 substrate-binding domain-containing protein [Archaeoglobaceae archaeon]